MHKILIVYASGYGATAEIAQEMANLLTRENVDVSVRELPCAENPAQYDAIIIGSAIQYDRWMPAARSFITDNEETLNKMPVAYFFNCLALARRTAETEKKAKEYVEKIVKLSDMVKPIGIGQFGGALNYTNMPFYLRIAFKVFGKIAGIQEGDYRDWNEIREWTKSIENKFESVS